MNTQKMQRCDKRQARQALSDEEKQQKSQKIAEKLIQTPAYQQAQTIGAYLCMPEEVNVKTIIDTAWADGKNIYLPVVLAWKQALKFAPYTPNTLLTKDLVGINIPDVCTSNYINANELDMVITPLVAFDENRNRIGMGGGFYDKTFAFKADNLTKPVLIGVAFEVQRVSTAIDTNPWDIRPDCIVSESVYT